MPTALFLSPHLDDVAFSCGGLLAQLSEAGWRTAMATAFTASVLPATGFALACQLDKGLGPEVDYMALRREEDRAAAAILGVAELRWLDLPEAPHRSYGAADQLFGEIHAEDEVWRPLALRIATLLDELQSDLVLAPQGLGGHVDHRQMVRAVAHIAPPHLAFYRDTPYAIRNPGSMPSIRGAQVTECSVRLAAGLDRKIAASCAYGSQIGFQFGGPAQLAAALREFALREGGSHPAERILVSRGPALDLLLASHQAALL